MDYQKLLNPVVTNTPPSGIRRFFDIVSEMKDAISLGVGEPDFVTPWSIREAAIYSLEKGQTSYTSNWGLIELRRLVARYMAERFQVEYNPNNEVLITVGASEGIDLAMRALLSPGDEVILPEPSYVSYCPCVQFAGGVPVAVPTHARDGFRLRPEALRAAITPRTKAILLPYPNNPTGSTLEESDLRALADVLRGTDIFVISDEIYGELTYGGVKHVSFASLPGMRERTITLNGFSKAFAMTGWRLGFACAPAPILDNLYKIHQYTMLCASRQSQHAAVEALQSAFENKFEHVRRMHKEYDRRRHLMVSGFNEMGLTCPDPLGAFYVFPDITSTGLSSETFAERLLYEHKLAVVPGTAFGPSGEGHIRCSYAYSVEKIQTALGRIRAFVDTL